MGDEPVILAIETALRTGSLSLLKGEAELASFRGEANISRAEDLLELISALLKKSCIKLSEIDLIAVSEGRGSFTGIRIGIATAKGLALGTGRPILGINVLEALAFSVNEPEVIAAVRTGRNQIGWQTFSDKYYKTEIGKHKPQVGTWTEFIEGVLRLEGQKTPVIMESGMLEELEKHPIPNLLATEDLPLIEYASDNAAALIGLLSYDLFKQNYIKQKEISPRYLIEAEIGRK